MEDNSKSKDRPATAVAGKAKVIDLTADMELSPESSGKIIDLTNVLNNQAAQSKQTSPAPLETSKSAPAETDRQNSAVEGSAPAAIEEEVDAAFDAFQHATSAAADQQKFTATDEKLQQLTEMADRAVPHSAYESDISPMPEPEAKQDRQAPESSVTVPDRAPESQIPAEPPETAGTELAGQLAEPEISAPEFSAGASDGDQDAPIELTDRVDPASPDMADRHLQPARESDEDEVIELTDRVDPVETTGQTAGAGAVPAETGDDEIIELTDIVDPAELGLPDVAVDDAEEVLELTDIVQPQEVISATPWPATNADGKDRQRAAESETQAPAAPSRQPGEAQKETDQVIQLADVLNNARPDEASRPDEITRNLDEDSMADVLEKEPSEGSTAVPNKEIEEAIERIIRTKYAQSIEKLIAQAVEKAVTREIKNIKRAIMDDNEPSP